MNINRTEKDGITILSIQGDVNIDKASQLRHQCEELFNQGVRKLVLDFADVGFIDSVGLALLIELLQQFRQNNGALVLVNVEDKVKHIFEISKIDMLMSIYKSKEDALASF